MLAACFGDEEQLYKTLCEQYQQTPEEILSLGSTKRTSVVNELPIKAPPKPTANTEINFHNLLRELYKRHNRKMLSSLNHLLTKYRGREQELYLKVCRKYNIKPKVISSVHSNNKFAIGEYVETMILYDVP